MITIQLPPEDALALLVLHEAYMLMWVGQEGTNPLLYSNCARVVREYMAQVLPQMPADPKPVIAILDAQTNF